MLHDSGVPEQFSMDRLLFKLARYEKTANEVLEYVLPQLEQVVYVSCLDELSNNP